MSKFHNSYFQYAVIGGPSFTDIPISKDDRTPIAVVVPGLTSDSFSPVSFLFQVVYSGGKVVYFHKSINVISFFLKFKLLTSSSY